MRQIRIVLAGLGLLLLTVTPLVASHPPVVDPQQSCVLPLSLRIRASPTVPVMGTLSYLAPLGTSIPGCLAPPPSPPLPPGLPPYVAEWGSHAPACPPPPFVGPIPGAFCGPVVLPGLTASCTWAPVVNTVPTGLVIGFDIDGSGTINWPPAGPEVYVAGPFAPGSWSVPNLYLLPPTLGRVIAYPTNIAFTGVLAPGDVNLVGCVTP